MNSKKVTIISITLAICLCLFCGIAVFAITVNGQKNDKKEAPKTFEDSNQKLAKIDKIEGSTVTVTFENLKRPDENENPENEAPAEDSTAETEQKQLTVKDTSLLDGITEGSMVFLELDPNDNNVITAIRKADDMKDKKDGSRITGRIDAINGDQVTLTLGDRARPDQNSESQSKPSDSFTAGTETKTYKVNDTSSLSNLKVGDIVMGRVSESDESVLEDIHSMSELPTGKPDGSNQKDPSDNNSNMQKPEDLNNSGSATQSSFNTAV